MNDKWHLEWAELRQPEDFCELFFVDAAETPEGWAFSNRSTNDVCWQTVPPEDVERMVVAAEHFKKTLLEKRPIMRMIVYAVRTEQKGFATIGIVGEIDPDLKKKRVWRNQTILVEMRLSDAKPLARTAAEQGPVAALAA